MKILIFLGLFVSLCGTAVAAQPLETLPNQGLAIIQRFGGIAKMTVLSNLESTEPAPLVIKTQEEFEKFVTLLPSMEQTRTTPSANKDPLLQKPRFDWDRWMLLVVFDSQSLSFPPNVNRVVLFKKQITAVVEYPDTKNLIEAKPPEIGSYGAALVTKSDLPLQWINPGHHNAEAPKESMMMFLPDVKKAGD